VRGGTPPADKVPAGGTQVVERAALMKRLEAAQKDAIAPLSANAKEFQRGSDRLAHDAELVAALAQIITREGYEFADDESYLEHARAMQAAATQVREAATSGNYEQARQAAGTLGKACAACHEGFRS
jgi:cytochrome c556